MPVRLPRRRLLAAAGVAALLSVVGAAGWAWGARVAQAPAATPVTVPSPDWVRVVTDLDAARGRAFATASPAGLRLVYADGSALRSQDEAALADLRRRGVVARGLVHDVREVVAGRVTGDRALLLVRQALRAYQLLDRTGLVLERHTAGPVMATEVTLLRLADGWRVESVRARQ